MTFENNKSFI